MDLNALTLFVEVAQAGSFANVARHRNIDPSSVSRSIAGLEDALGFRLFQRTTRRLALTEAGANYLGRIAPMVDELNQAAASALDLSKAPSGTLRVTASVSYGHMVVVPLIPSFRRLYPDISIDLELTDTNVDLIAERIDVAIRLGLRPDMDVICAKLADTTYRVCASPEYLKTHGVPALPRDLSSHACLRFPFPGFHTSWKFKPADGEVIDVPVDGPITASNALALRQLAVDGQGLVLLADWMVDIAIADGSLVDLFPDYAVTAADFGTGVWMLYPSRSYLPSKVRVFLDFLRQNVGM